LNGWELNTIGYELFNYKIITKIHNMIINYLNKHSKLNNSIILDLASGISPLTKKLIYSNPKKIILIDNSYVVINKLKYKYKKYISKNKVNVINKNILSKNLISNIKKKHNKINLILFNRALYFSDKDNIKLLKNAYGNIEKNGYIIIIHPERNIWKYSTGIKNKFVYYQFLRRCWGSLGILFGIYRPLTSKKLNELCVAACPKIKIITLKSPAPAYNIRIIKKI
jgi:hypothetical protein